MEQSNFLSQMLAYKKFEEDLHKLHDMGFDFMEGKFPLGSHVLWLFESSIKSHYGDEGWGWVEWFAFESDWGKKDWSKAPSFRINEEGKSEVVDKGENSQYGAFDEEGNPICYDFESLWEYLEKNFKNNINEN